MGSQRGMITTDEEGIPILSRAEERLKGKAMTRQPLGKEMWEMRRSSTVLDSTKKGDKLRKGRLQIAARRGYCTMVPKD